MKNLDSIKEKAEQKLRSIEYEIYEYRDQLKTDMDDVKRDEIKKELSYLTGRAESLRYIVEMLEGVLN